MYQFYENIAQKSDKIGDEEMKTPFDG